MADRVAPAISGIDTNPNPTNSQWESFFEDNFNNISDTEGDAVLRDGFAALIAARAAADPDQAQLLMYQSNGLVATHEQEGVQGHLDCLDRLLIPDAVEAWFVGLRNGDTDLNGSTQLDIDYRIDLNDLDTPPDTFNRIWDVPLFDMDPNLGDPSLNPIRCARL